MTVYSTTMAYTAQSPSLSAPYTLINTSAFSSIADYNRSIEFDKAKALFNIMDGDKTFTVVVSNMYHPPKDVEKADEIFAALKEG